ncbi:uncharacterized protein [Marmota flaviventris]|uniref:uncharacterized protein n=1 Tax=Marmota flaviventris TaxID=93162 RepID=UPI003A8B72B9
MLEQNTSSAPSQSTTMAPRKHTKKGKKGQGKSGVPTPSAIPQSLPTQKHQSLPQGTSTPTEKGISSCPSVPGTSRRSESPDLLPELMSAFGAWCSSSPKGETPSTRQQHGASLEQNLSSAPSQSTTMAPRKHTIKGKKGQGKSGVPTPSGIPQSLTTQKHLSSLQGTSTTTEKVISILPMAPVTSRRSESPDLLPEMMSAFGAWCSSSQRGESPSNRQQHGARLEWKTSSAPSQNTTMAPQKNTKEGKKGQENSRISTLSAIPQSLLTQKHQNSPQETSTTKGISSFSLVPMTSRGSGSQDLLPELITALGALCISSQRGGTPSNRQQHGAQNTSSAPSQSTTVALGKHTEKGTKGQGNTHVPTLTAIPQSLPTQKHLSSPCGTSSTASKDTSSYPLVPMTSRESGSHDMLPELIIAFEALCISSNRGGTPSNRQQHGAQLEHNTSSAPSQRTTMGTKGQKARHTPRKETSGVATVTAIPQSLPTQKGLSSPGGTSTTSSKSTSTLTSTHNPSLSPGSPDWLPDLISAFGAMVISPRGETRSVRKR